MLLQKRHHLAKRKTGKKLILILLKKDTKNVFVARRYVEKKFNGHKIKHSIQKKYVQSCFQRMNENFKNANVVLLLFTTYRNVVGVIRSSPTLES